MTDVSEPKRIPHLRETGVIFLDVETTGLDPSRHEILEIAIVDLSGHALVHTKIRPVHIETAEPEALRINGYAEHPELWANAPTFVEMCTQIRDALNHCVIVGHNPGFDRSFVISEMTRAGVEKPDKYVRRHIIDTTTLAWEHLVPCGLDRLNLDAICQFLEIPLDRTKRHGALEDTMATREAYLRMIRATQEHRAQWEKAAVARAAMA